MTQQYKIGDRVELVTNGGYASIFKPGMLGTVLQVSEVCVLVCVDGDCHRQGLNFYFGEVKPLVITKPDTGLFLLIRQSKKNPEKFKVIFNGRVGGDQKSFSSRRLADDAASRMNKSDHALKFNYFVVEKETV